MSSSPLSNTIKRTSDLLRLGASDQVTEYENRFQSLRALHDRLLSDFIISDFNNEKAYQTTKQFFTNSPQIPQPPNKRKTTPNLLVPNPKNTKQR